jgi:hypothetical protein
MKSKVRSEVIAPANLLLGKPARRRILGKKYTKIRAKPSSSTGSDENDKYDAEQQL